MSNQNEKNPKTEQKITGEYVPVKPVDPNEYSVEQYLFDTNTLLTQIDNDLRFIIQLLAQNKEEKPKPRTIGMRND